MIGPNGVPIFAADLPPNDAVRWVVRRKALVVAAVRGGLITLEEACERYKLSVEEFQSWQRAVDKHGVPRPRITKMLEYRIAKKS